MMCKGDRDYFVMTVGEFFALFKVPKGLEDVRALFSDDDFVHVWHENGKVHCSFRAR